MHVHLRWTLFSINSKKQQFVWVRYDWLLAPISQLDRNRLLDNQKKVSSHIVVYPVIARALEKSFTVRTDHSSLQWMITRIDPNGKMMRWRLQLVEFGFEILCYQKLARQVTYVLIRLLHQSNTIDYEAVDVGLATFESSSATLEQRLKEKRVQITSFLDPLIKLMCWHGLTLLFTPFVCDNLGDDFNLIDWIIKTNKLQALNNLVVSQSTLELLGEQKYYQFGELILATKASDPCSGLNKGDYERLHHQHHLIPELWYLNYCKLSGRKASEEDYILWITAKSRMTPWRYVNARKATADL